MFLLPALQDGWNPLELCAGALMHASYILVYSSTKFHKAQVKTRLGKQLGCNSHIYEVNYKRYNLFQSNFRHL